MNEAPNKYRLQGIIRNQIRSFRNIDYSMPISHEGRILTDIKKFSPGLGAADETKNIHGFYSFWYFTVFILRDENISLSSSDNTSILNCAELETFVTRL